MNKIGIAHEKFAQQIVKDFKGRITGHTVDEVIGDNPENVFFVGKLLSGGAEDNSVYSSDWQIKSLGVDFYIQEEQFNESQIRVWPEGDFFYRAYPTLEQQRCAFVDEINKGSIEKYNNFDEIVEISQKDPAKFNKVKASLVPIYKRINISSESFYLEFALKDLIIEGSEYGFADEAHAQNLLLEEHIQTLQTKLEDDKYRYKYEIHEKTQLKDLLNEEAYQKFLDKKAIMKDVPIAQNWRVYVEVEIKKLKSKYMVTVSLVNDSAVQSNATSHSSNSRASAKSSVETLFNSGLKVQLNNADFDPIELDYFLDDYKYDKRQPAVGTNCSVTFCAENNTIETENLPLHTQYRLVTNDEYAIKFQDLITNPLAKLRETAKQMRIKLAQWEREFDDAQKELTNIAKQNWKGELKDFEMEIKRFERGIGVINDYPLVYKSFVLMNQTFLNTAKKYDTWRLFQIVFIVSIIPDIVACDANIMPKEEREKTALGDVSLLYFPTGGGKTEAFFGALVFNLFFDRYRGKTCGVTSILRYPLRLLSVQQVQRLANTLAQAELLRRKTPNISESEEFSLGYFVGDGSTPNRIKHEDAEKLETATQAEKDENRIVDICPFCGKQTVHVDFDSEKYRLIHYCDNPECESGRVLPIYMVDREIYRYLPSAIISTVDKMALLGMNSNFRNIFLGATQKCPYHGYTSTGKCLEKEHCHVDSFSLEEIDMYDPAPTLFIQDELHLIRESLGTYASHYESLISYLIQNVSKSKRKIKIIGASATISSYEKQITQLYGKDPLRFPCASPKLSENFYSHIDTTDQQRLILGYAPFGKAIINSVVYSMKYMREVVNDYLKEPQRMLTIPDIGITTIEEAKKVLENYWIFLEYNNVKRDGNNVDGALENPINIELQHDGYKEFISREMTGDESFQAVREVLSEVENSQNVFDGLNLIIATSMISHGVDADRFNIMFFFGMPGNTAEYIQAYSRTGRKFSSIVVDIMRPSRETDQSYLRNFKKFHEFKDILVEPVPINKWATKAISGTIPGIFGGLLLEKYDVEIADKFLFFMKNIKQVIAEGKLTKEQVKTDLYRSYGCLNGDEFVELGNQYKQSIDSFVENIFDQIMDKNWENESIIDGFQRMGYHIMQSLRDTDTQLIIELD